MRKLPVWVRPAVPAQICTLWLIAELAAAGSLTVHVLDRDGRPVPEVAVYAEAIDGPAAAVSLAGDSGPAAPNATMNQHERSFDPHILIIETGTRVDFPNSDDIRHHVYSFSPAKRFNFSIDSGQVHEALQFDVPGVVTLGCNIHDDMLGYILVVDTPHFAKTDGHGQVVLASLAAGRYEVGIWSPRVGSRHQPEAQIVDVASDQDVEYEQRFEDKLYPPHQHSDTTLIWHAY
jgi:plastocyanin